MAVIVDVWSGTIRMPISTTSFSIGFIPIFTLGLEGRARSRWIDLLELSEGDLVLDIATGIGKNISILRRRVGDEGLVVGVDISLSMLRYAAKVARKFKNVVLIRANASYLPFKDCIFDAVFHVDGINTFEDKELAIREMFRVAKSDASIVVVDEGLDPKLRNTKRGKKLQSKMHSTPHYPP